MGIADFVRHRYPIDGLAIDDLTDALAVLANSPDIGAPRILRIEALHDGQLLVESGFQAAVRAGSGKSILMRRTEAGWAVVEVGRWKS
jgi:hypothetical protein